MANSSPWCYGLARRRAELAMGRKLERAPRPFLVGTPLPPPSANKLSLGSTEASTSFSWRPPRLLAVRRARFARVALICAARAQPRGVGSLELPA